MKIILRAGGLMRSGPERDLVDDYLQRAQLLARNVGFLSVDEQSIDLSKCRDRSEETRKLVEGLSDNSALFILDERGKALKSRQFASAMAEQRDLGFSSLVFLIGGADGFDPSELPPQARKISFGIQTWPHKLVRVMLAEQIYRGLGILAGTPYHRD